MADWKLNYGATGAPLVVGDLVVAPISGGDEGVRGFLSAYKASTGERVWRFWTVPGRGEPGSETWSGDSIDHGGSSTWMTGTYDPDTKLLYWGVGNPGPDHNGDQRKGDNLYSCSILALDVGTGKLRWHRQMTPYNLHDWDATQTPMLADTIFRGRQRKLLMQANRNGFFYVIDRLTGELLLAEPFVKNLTWATGIGKDGRPSSRQAMCPLTRERAPAHRLRGRLTGRRRPSTRSANNSWSSRRSLARFTPNRTKSSNWANRSMGEVHAARREIPTTSICARLTLRPAKLPGKFQTSAAAFSRAAQWQRPVAWFFMETTAAPSWPQINATENCSGTSTQSRVLKPAR